MIKKKNQPKQKQDYALNRIVNLFQHVGKK